MSEEDSEHSETSVLKQLGDELQLQAWLAGAELRNPSLAQPGVRDEVDLLARLRDELRVQIHLGKLEATEEFEQLEHRWVRIKSMATAAADEAGESLHDLLRDIRDGYQRLRRG